MIMIIAAACIVASMSIVICDNRTELDWQRSMLLAMLVAILMWITAEDTRRKTCIETLNGNPPYHLVEQEDGSVKWMEVER